MPSISNVVILFNNNDQDSYEFAKYYADAHNLSYDSLVALNCSLNEILSSYEQFQEEIETELLEYIYTYDEYFSSSLKYIIVGYNVPGGFHDGDDIISTTSRLSRIFHPYVKKENNPIYNRKIVQGYDSLDSFNALIVSRIDAEDLETAKSFVDNAIKIMKQNVITGKFYFDKYTIIEDELDLDYYEDLEDFENNILDGLNITNEKTEFWDEYTDIPIFKLENDSFMWSWKSDKTSLSFFQETNNARVFLYNGDSFSAETLRDIESNRFCPLALYSGYVSCAGALSDPGVDGYLRPFPFFQYLSLGKTIGECFNYSVPHFNWTIGLFGDPLVTIKFPEKAEINLENTTVTAYNSLHNSLSKCIGYAWNIQNNLQNIRDDIASSDAFTKYDLFILMENLYSSVVVNDNFKSLSNYFIANFNQSSKFDKFLLNNNLKLSPLIADSSGFSIDSSLQLKQGSWVLESNIDYISGQYDWFQFELEASYLSDFSVLFLSTSTENSLDGWEYEKLPNVFEIFPNNGITTSFAGRKIKYSSQENLNRGDIFWVRIRQKNLSNQYTDWISYKRVVNT